MTETTVEVRPLRICDVCGAVDDLPRHVVAHPEGAVPVNASLVVSIAERTDLDEALKRDLVADIVDTTLELRHIHCCAVSGTCPDGTCVQYVSSGAAPEEMLAHIQTNPLPSNLVYADENGQQIPLEPEEV